MENIHSLEKIIKYQQNKDPLSPCQEHLYYAFRQGPVYCIVLDTGEDKPDSDIEYAGIPNMTSTVPNSPNGWPVFWKVPNIKKRLLK